MILRQSSYRPVDVLMIHLGSCQLILPTKKEAIIRRTGRVVAVLSLGVVNHQEKSWFPYVSIIFQLLHHTVSSTQPLPTLTSAPHPYTGSLAPWFK